MAEQKYKINNEVFSRISTFVNREYGIQLPSSKKIMIESRLAKRLRKLDMKSFSAYADYIFSPRGRETELLNMVDLLTTNKTDFFREPDHFDYLTHSVLPAMFPVPPPGTANYCNAWSCGCSSGEEPYTLAMVLNEFARRSPAFKYSVKASDVSSKVLEKGESGIYTEEEILPVPMGLRHKYLLRNKDRSEPLVKIIPEIQNRVQFKKLNLMDSSYSFPTVMDFIFYRNVAIYFNKSMQEEIVNKICRHLKLGGYLFIGHSESLFNMNVPLEQVESTIYRKL